MRGVRPLVHRRQAVTRAPVDLAARRSAQQSLAAEARARADAEPPGSLGRKAWGCAAVALATTGTLAAARRALGDVGAADVRQAALAALGSLEREQLRALMTEVPRPSERDPARPDEED